MSLHFKYKKFSKLVGKFCLLLASFALMASSLPLEKVSQKPKSTHFLSLADIHFDPFLSCPALGNCPLIDKLEQSPASGWDALFAKEDHSSPHYTKDSNYSLIKSSIVEMKKQGQIKSVAFALVIGDVLTHEFEFKYRRYTHKYSKKNYQAFIKKTLEFLATQIKEILPNKNIYFAVGNNDSYTGDYAIDAQGSFFKDSGELWAKQLTGEADRAALQQQYAKAGYYALNAPEQAQLRLIFLNSVIFSKKALAKNVGALAQEQLAWLHQELAQAAAKQQKVFIIMHIPTGIDVYASFLSPFSLVEFWRPAYTERFLAEIKTYSNTITGVFTAHIHADVLQILNNGRLAEVPAIGTPSISPIFGNNPGFKIFNYETASSKLENFATYFFSMDKTQSWQKEYDFNEAYQATQPEQGTGSLLSTIKRIERNGLLATNYKTFYAVGRNTQPITKANKWSPYYWCALRGITAQAYQSCLHQPASMSGSDQIPLNL